MNSKSGDGISVKVYEKDGILFSEMYNTSLMGDEWSLFDHAHFKELCMFNENIEGIHLSVASSLTEMLNGQMEAGYYKEVVAGYRFSLPVFCNGEGKDFYEDKGLIFQ